MTHESRWRYVNIATISSTCRHCSRRRVTHVVCLHCVTGPVDCRPTIYRRTVVYHVALYYCIAIQREILVLDLLRTEPEYRYKVNVGGRCLHRHTHGTTTRNCSTAEHSACTSEEQFVAFILKSMLHHWLRANNWTRLICFSEQTELVTAVSIIFIQCCFTCRPL